MLIPKVSTEFWRFGIHLFPLCFLRILQPCAPNPQLIIVITQVIFPPHNNSEMSATIKICGLVGGVVKILMGDSRRDPWIRGTGRASISRCFGVFVRKKARYGWGYKEERELRLQCQVKEFRLFCGPLRGWRHRGEQRLTCVTERSRKPGRSQKSKGGTEVEISRASERRRREWMWREDCLWGGSGVTWC